MNRRVGQNYNLFFSNISLTDLVSSDGIVPLPKFENSTTILTAIRIGTEEDNYI